MLAFRLFKSYIFSSRSESLLRVLTKITLSSSFLTVFSLVVVISIMNGFNRNMAHKLLAVEPHVSVRKDAIEDRKVFLGSLPDGVKVTDFEEQDLVIRTVDGLFSGAVARGLSRDDISILVERLAKASGRSADLYFHPRDLEPDQVILGADLARSLNVLQGDDLSLVAPESLLLPAGEIVPVERVRIVGVLQSDVTTFDSQALIYLKDPGLNQLKNSKTRIEKVDIHLDDPYSVASVVEIIREKGLKPKANVQTWQSTNLPLFFALRMEKWAMTLLLGLSVLVTSFSIIMLLLMLITEKRKDIGVFMAMGLSKAQAGRMFTGIGFLLASCGSISGLVVGALVSRWLEKNPVAFMPSIYTDSSLPAQVQFTQVLIIAAFLLILAFLAAWLPVRQLTKGTPSENLRGQITPKH